MAATGDDGLRVPAAVWGFRGGSSMDGWIGVIVVLAVWTLVQTWLLPRLGVPT